MLKSRTYIQWVAEKGMGISMPMVTVQERPATKGCITTSSWWLWTTKLLTIQVQCNACWYFGILQRVFYTSHEAQSLLQTHDVPHCGQVQDLKCWPQKTVSDCKRPKQSLTHSANLLRLKGHLYLYIERFLWKGEMEIRMVCQVHWFL